MNKRFLLLISLMALLAIPGLALAQDKVQPQHSDPVWQATYWNNKTLTGQPALTVEEANLDHDWGLGSPAPGVVQADQFSARWTRYLDLEAGTYRFTATSDDGIRVYLNGTRIIDKWYDHGVQTFSADRTVSTGHHLVVVDYYENTGAAVARFSWAPVANISEWRGEYYNTKTITNQPALVRNDKAINFDWGGGSPAPGIVNADLFSVRWTRSLGLEAGSYRFSMTVDDGGRLWVNNHLLIDAWRDQVPTTYTGDIYLPGGTVAIKMEYYENYGSAVAKLTWTPGSGGGHDTPDAVVVDDGGPGFQKGGSKTGWHTQAEGYGGDLTWTKNNDWQRPNYNWARWYPTLKSGRYEVFVYIPDRYTTTAKARYWVSHAQGLTLRIVDQSANGGKWVSLGTYTFQGNSEDYVSLADVTFEPYLSRIIAWDAVKWARK